MSESLTRSAIRVTFGFLRVTGNRNNGHAGEYAFPYNGHASENKGRVSENKGHASENKGRTFENKGRTFSEIGVTVFRK